MVLIGAISIVRGILLFIAQMIGAIVAAYVVQALFTGALNVSTALSPTTTVAQGVLVEMLLTAQLVFTIFMLAAEKHVGNFIAPVGIGLSLFIAELTGEFLGLPIFRFVYVRPSTLPTVAHDRHILDWRLAEPSPLFRTTSRNRQLYRGAVDLLGWANRRFDPRDAAVQAH